MSEYDNLIQLISMNNDQIIQYLSAYLRSLNGMTEPVVSSDFLYLDNYSLTCLVAHTNV